MEKVNFKQWLNENLTENSSIDYDIGGRGGYLTVLSETVFDVLNIPEKYLNCVPRKIGAGCNYLGGGVRGSVFTVSADEYIQHGLPKTYAIKLRKAGEVLVNKYLEIENGMNDEVDEEGETNWEAMATNASRRAGVISAY